MMSTRFFDWCVLAALTGLAALGIARAIVLYARGVHVVAIDWQRSAAQQFADALAIVLFLSWAYEVVADTWPLRGHVFPEQLGVVLVDSLGCKIAGVVLLLAGLLIFGLALAAFAESWRIGIDRQTPGSLVMRGIFAWTRNPIYIALDLILFGSFLVLGRAIFLGLALAITVLLHYQIRREEGYLAGAYGDAYREYCSRVGRYVTWR